MPDACFVDAEDRAVLLESKFAARADPDQLRRHTRTAARRGLTVQRVLLLSAELPSRRLPQEVNAHLWTDIYIWLRSRQRRHPWAAACADFMDVAEARGVAENYLKRGALTMFSGIPFDKDNPYTYNQAKHSLGLLVADLRAHKRLRSSLSLDLEDAGRGAITGRRRDNVWDFIALKVPRRASEFTRQPHLTVSITRDWAYVALTVPHRTRAAMRSGLIGEDFETFRSLILKVSRGIQRALPGALLVWARQQCDAPVQNTGAYAAAVDDAYAILRSRCQNVQLPEEQRRRPADSTAAAVLSDSKRRAGRALHAPIRSVYRTATVPRPERKREVSAAMAYGSPRRAQPAQGKHAVSDRCPVSICQESGREDPEVRRRGRGCLDCVPAGN